MSGPVEVAGDQLRTIVERIEKVEEELKEQGALDRQGAHYLHVLNAECRRLTMILDNFMKFARPVPVRLHELDVQNVIGHVMALMQFEAEERKVRLEQRIEEGFPSVFGDETQVSQVLVNIVVNAFHAMPDGGLCRIVAHERKTDNERRQTDNSILVYMPCFNTNLQLIDGITDQLRLEDAEEVACHHGE